MTERVIWCERGWLTIHYGFCPSETAWKREMKRFGRPQEPYPRSDARCTVFDKADGTTACIVTVRNDLDGRCPVGIMALITHEAFHVFEAACSHMAEANPSSEFSAYSIQNITFNLCDAYDRTRGGLRPRAADSAAQPL